MQMAVVAKELVTFRDAARPCPVLSLTPPIHVAQTDLEFYVAMAGWLGQRLLMLCTESQLSIKFKAHTG